MDEVTIAGAPEHDRYELRVDGALVGRGLQVLPTCPFVSAFLARPEHADYRELVEPHLRAALHLPAGGPPPGS